MFRYVVLAGGLALAALALFHPAPRALTSLATPAPLELRPRRAAGAATIVVYVAGAVRHPGLYHVRAGARADDAVRLAGGLTPQADAIAVNLAQTLTDGDEVAVPHLGEPRSRRAKRTAHGRRNARRRRASAVWLNDADAQALAAVPGIGDAIAARIVELREREGPFDSLDQLLDVAGMNAGRLERARPYLRL